MAWAILVAKIVKDNPKAQPNQVLAKFFSFYKDYNWNSENPIILMEIANDPNVVTFRDADNMIYKPTGQEMMPIITPAFPSMNTTYAMGASQKRVVLTEFEKAARITAELMKNPKTS